MTVLSNIITPSNVLTTTNTATVTNKTLTAPTVTGMVVSDGTANGVTYLNGSKVLTSGSALTFDGTNLGVGIASAGTKVDVAGAVRSFVSGGTPIFYLSNGTTQHSIQNNSGSLAFYNDGTRGMDLTSTGLGIGTSSPAYKLDITSASDASLLQIKSTAIANNTAMRFGIDGNNSFINASGGSIGVLQLRVFGTTQATLDASGNLGLGVTPSATNTSYKAQEIGFVGNGLIGFGANDFAMSSGAYYSSSGWKHSATNSLGASFYEQYTGQHIWYNKTAVSHTAGDAITFTQAMTLDASGNLGVGTTSPQLKFVVSNGGAQGFEVNPNSGIISGGIDILCYNRSAAAYKPIYTNAEYHVWATSTTERARIDSSGNLLVALTSQVGSGTICTVNSATKNGVVVKDSASGSALYLGLNTSNVTVFQVAGNGNVTNTNNSYGAISDVKLKENIVDATPKLASLMQVKIRNYNLIGDTTKQIGVVAQELETVFPAMVDESPDRDTEGNVLGTTTKSVKYSVFVPMLVKAIQEQQAIIETLKARLDAANL